MWEKNPSPIAVTAEQQANWNRMVPIWIEEDRVADQAWQLAQAAIAKAKRSAAKD